jgi:glycosyltransferase involved in cell wall biosynthesis
MEHKFQSEIAPPTVSVVIPLYNKGQYVERALHSVLTQTRPAAEIIVIDDGSTDDGPERVKKLALLNPSINLVRQENKGPGPARNAGMALAKSKYIAFLDADDEWLPSFLEAGLTILEDAEANAAVACTGRIRTPDMHRSAFDGSDGVYEITTDADFELAERLFNFRPIPSFMIMRTETARKWGGFFDRYKCISGEDRYLSLKLWFNERMGIITEPHGIYHTEASDLSSYGHKNQANKQLAPYLIDPTDILDSCPKDKRHLLKKLLAKMAAERAEQLAKFGRGREARKLVDRFRGMWDANLKQKLRLELLIMTAPALPAVRGLWKLRKSLKFSK